MENPPTGQGQVAASPPVGALAMRVPLVNLQEQYAALEPEMLRAIQEVCRTQRFVLGPKGQQLEEAVARVVQVPEAIGVSSGTDALLVSLMALGIGPGDEVLTTPFTFFATAGSVTRVGATPVFVDIDRESMMLDPQQLAKVLAKRARAKAILPVHLFGQCADMEPILSLAHQHGLPVIEDAAQALGTHAGGRPAGSMGEAGCFSFFPSKNLGAFGDGGMVVTGDRALAERIRLLRNHGSHPKYYHQLIGGNFRLDELQAAVLLVKLPHLAGWNAARQARAETYRALFERHGLLEQATLPRVREGFPSIFHQYVIRTTQRDPLRAHLASHGVETEIYYPVPLHLQACYQSLGYRDGDFPEAERAAREVLALPMHPELQPEQQEHVVTTMAAFFRS